MISILNIFKSINKQNKIEDIENLKDFENYLF